MTLINTTWGVQIVETAIEESEYICGLVDGLIAGQPALINALIPLQVLRDRLNLGGVVKSIRTETSDYTIVSTDYKVLADASNNTVDILLPADPNHGQIFEVYCIDSTFTCTVKRNGKNINGSASDKVLTITESVTLQYDETYGWTY